MYLFIMMECLCSFSMIDNVSYIAIYLILLYSGIRCICSGNHHISPHNRYGTFNYILTVNNCVTWNTFTDTCSEIDSITFKHVNIRILVTFISYIICISIQWTANSMETTFSGTIASAANTYCESNVAACGLETCCTSV